MLPENKEFLVRGEDGEEYGPVGLEELRQWVRENRAGVGSFVRPDEPGAIWEPWQQYPELVALAAEAQVAGPASDAAAGLTIAPMGRRVLAGVADVILSSILSAPIVFMVFFVSVLHSPPLAQEVYQLYLQPQNPIPEQLYHDMGPDYVIGNLIVYAVLALYMTGFHAAHGQTPAKALMHLRVVGRDGRKPPLARSMLRGLLFSLSVYLYCFPLLYMLISPHRRAFHDFVADTCVVEA